LALNLTKKYSEKELVLIAEFLEMRLALPQYIISMGGRVVSRGGDAAILTYFRAEIRAEEITAFFCDAHCKLVGY